MTMRLQKFLSAAGVTSRRAAEKLITDGKVKVNGVVITRLGSVVDEELDHVECNGKTVRIDQEKVYIALHKPEGYVSSTSSKDGDSVLKLVAVSQKLYPVGRLDKQTTGLLLLTNDGEFANAITHPRYGCTKEYFAVLDQDLRPEDIKRLEKGMKIDGKRVQGVTVVSHTNQSARLMLNEGVNRQIRRMLGGLGYTVKKLKRVRVGKLELGALKPGQWKKISKDQVL
jgi:23S rRNA pseudouridine2605 synthase